MGLYASRLVLSDRVTLAFVDGTPVLDSRARAPIGGRTPREEITLRGQVELDQGTRRREGDLGAEYTSRSTLILDAAECARRAFTPTPGATVLRKVKWAAGNETEHNLYLDEVTRDASGGIFRCSLSDRQPGRAS
jgi:hypothetical protein